VPKDAWRLDPTAARILDSLAAGVVVADANRVIRYRNSIAAAWLSEGKDLDSAFVRTVLLGRSESCVSQFQRTIDEQTPIRIECAIPFPTAASPMLATLRCTPLVGEDSQHADGIVILIEQRAEQAAVDERIEVSKRLASLGKLATRVAHELNNPLDGILRYINLAMRLVDDASESKLKDYLAESRTGLMRMVQIISDLLEFSRSTEGNFEQTSVNEVVEQAIRAHASTADENHVVVAADFQTQDLPSIRGSRLYQVCCNLIKNAIEAMPEGGRLSITVGSAADQVIIRVADTGVGLPDPPDEVFKPFYTTKKPGKGTGIGLAICKDFIEDMQGTITASPGEDSGAVFTVRIPQSSLHRPLPLQAPAEDKP
jgi:signal transduction histidine kinase